MTQTHHTTDGRDPATQAIRVFLATPVTDLTRPIYDVALAKTLIQLEREGIGWEWCLLRGNCHVDDARNTLVRNFRGSKCTHLFFLDSDVGWNAPDLVRFLRMDVDFVAGIYPFKGDYTKWPVEIEPGPIEGYYNEHAPQGLVPVRRVPTGFMCLKRSVIDKMVELAGTRRYKGGDHRDDLPLTSLIFERTLCTDPNGEEGDRRWGGDYDFCNRWRAAGGKVWVDPTIHLQHQGDWTWEGSVGEFWKQMTGQNVVETRAKRDACFEKIAADPVAAAVNVELLLETVGAWNNPWGIPPDQLSVLMSLALQAQGPTLECGSGLSTIILAIIAKFKGRVHYALEHSEWHEAKNTVVLRRHGLTKHCQIIPAPLEIGDGKEWYAVPDSLPKAALLFVDGPPQEVDVNTRWMAVERLKDRLLPGAVVMADDVDQKGLNDHIPEWEKALNCKFTVLDGKPRRFAVGRLPASVELSAAG